MLDVRKHRRFAIGTYTYFAFTKYTEKGATMTNFKRAKKIRNYFTTTTKMADEASPRHLH